MNPSDFLAIADELSRDDREAAWRSAISRAYYAVFHGAGALFEQLGFAVPASDRGHNYLWVRLNNSGHALVARAGRMLNDLRSQRNWADYRLTQFLDQDTTLAAVLAATELMELLVDITNEPSVHAQIIPVMRDYERQIGDVTFRP